MQIVFVEVVALIILLLSAFIWSKFFASARGGFSPFWFPWAFRRPWVAVLLVGVFAFLASAAPTIFTGIPQPRVQDEFSYLLAADTFAHGRLTNPTPRFWKHFESMHIIMRPTYASKYPPAQGLALAFGQVFFGHPIIGVWLSVAAACAAICWMLCGWCPVRWAWTGGLVAVVRIALSGPAYFGEIVSQGYWSQSYWGGAVAALGGALVFGALPRIIKRQRPRDAIVLAVGLAILANSRPFEGLVVSIPVMGILVIWFLKPGEIGVRNLSCRVLAPILLVLTITGIWMGFYNYRVTGNPLLMPYVVHERTYAIAPPFLWQSPREEPKYDHKIMKEFYEGWAYHWYTFQHSFHGWILMAYWKIVSLWCFFIGALFTPFFATLRLSLRRRGVQLALGTWALLMVALLTETWTLPHYAAPASSLAFLLVVESLRQAQLAKWHGKKVGRFIVRAVLPLLLVSSTASFALAHYLAPPNWAKDRYKIERTLEQEGGKDLIIVRYGPQHCVHDEWVYNRADIDASKIVWARDMGLQSDMKLIEYFKGRHAWLLEPDRIPPHLRPYPFKSTTKSLKQTH